MRHEPKPIQLRKIVAHPVRSAGSATPPSSAKFEMENGEHVFEEVPKSPIEAV
jgi:hypothetical protein